MSRPNVADWQYLGVDKITRRLEWNSGHKARKGHICEDSLAYASYSSKEEGDGERERESCRDRQKEGWRDKEERGREGGREPSSICQFPIFIEKLGNDTNHKCSVLRPIYTRRYFCGISRGAIFYRRLLRLH